MKHIAIRKFESNDFDPVSRIYGQGIETRNATFETHIKSWDEWNEAYLATCRLVAHIDKNIIGWAALSSISKRPAYRGVAEVSVYVDNDYKKMGVGSRLLRALVNQSKQEGFWTLEAKIFPENKSSIALHLKNNFKIVGRREKIGQLYGIWRDVILMERRSK